jgi:DNA-binding NarL/FixJ family response regulator
MRFVRIAARVAYGPTPARTVANRPELAPNVRSKDCLIHDERAIDDMISSGRALQRQSRHVRQEMAWWFKMASRSCGLDVLPSMATTGNRGALTVLVVEHDDSMATDLTCYVQCSGWRAQVERSVSASVLALEHSKVAAAIVELRLPDGLGFDVVHAMRVRCRQAPSLVLATSIEPDHINRAQLMGVEYACKPVRRENVDQFLSRCREIASTPADLVSDVAIRHRLTPAQSRLVQVAIESTSHDTLCERLGVSPNTIKTQIRGILMRTGAVSLEDLVSRIRAAALRRPD